MDETKYLELLHPLDLKPLSKIWAKVEILLGLCSVFLGLTVVFAPVPNIRPFGSTESSPLLGTLTGLVLFVLGGYLAMAGHRSHIYQSNNLLTAFLAEEIRKIREREPAQ